MSLCVWLPLTKDLRQQGLSDVTVTNNGATYSATGGKLGGAYSFDGSDDRIWTTGLNISGDAISACCWFKRDSSYGNEGYIMSLNNGSGYSDCEVGISSDSSHIIGVAGGINCSYSCTHGVWHHIAVTYDKQNIKTYLDGVLLGTVANTNSLIKPHFTVGARANGGNGGSGISYPFKGQISDVRIYSHCLSPMEVKQISQGLVLHYPLNRNGWGQENLLLNSGIFTSTSGWTNNQNTTLSVEDNELKVIINQTSSTPGIKVATSFSLVAGTYTASLLIKVENGNKNYVNYPFYMATSGGTALYGGSYTKKENKGGYIYEEATFSLASDADNVIFYILTSGPANGETWHLKWVKLEKGSTATPWCPNSSDTLATTMGLNSTTEYDCSGFCNNGTRTGTFDWISNTAKYAVSTKFNGTDNAIQTPSLPTMITDKNYTIAVWIYKTVIGSKGYQTIYGGPSGFEIEARNGGANETKFVPWNWGKPMASYELNEWNHCVFVHSDADCKIYLNGEYIATGTAKASNPTGNYFVGAWNTATQQNFDGLMSDFRIYATALSASDVKSLYQNCATIDPDGTIRGKIRS